MIEQADEIRRGECADRLPEAAATQQQYLVPAVVAPALLYQ